MLKLTQFKGVGMVRFVFMIIVIPLILGCSSKKEDQLMEAYTQNISYHKHLQHTEKTELYEDNKSVAILTATYLYANNFEKNDTRPEKFIVGVTFENPEEDVLDFRKKSMQNSANHYSLSLNNTYATKVEKLDFDDRRLKSISFVTEWGEYYEVTFPHINSQRFSLVFSHPIYGKGVLQFAKKAKFVYTKKGF